MSDYREDDAQGGLDAAKRKLDAVEPTLDVEKVLAENRIRREREKESRRQAEQKLEKELASARERGNVRRAHELEAERLQQAKAQSRELEAVRRTLDAEKARLKSSMKDKPKKRDA